jgi:uroporphyrin-III C-methyltransferase
MKSAKVYIMGAGPGDPELLTIKAHKILGRAEVILYDRLIEKSILDLAPAECRRIYVGKESGFHSLPQDQINEKLLEMSMKYEVVVRLKGGDPFVFGRGGEEAQVLGEHGVSFEIIPGVTSAVAAAAYAGIPITHRGISSSCAFVAGHHAPHLREDVCWEALAKIHTVVFYMGVRNRQQIAKKLIEEGRDESDPVAFIYRGTTPFQKSIETTLLTVAENPPPVESPAIFVIGKVVSLATALTWYKPVSNFQD